MKALRRTTFIISLLSIVAIIFFWISMLTENGHLPEDALSISLKIACFELFYIVLLWVPYHFKESPQIITIDLIAFILCLMPIILLVNRIRGIQC